MNDHRFNHSEDDIQPISQRERIDNYVSKGLVPPSDIRLLYQLNQGQYTYYGAEGHRSEVIQRLTRDLVHTMNVAMRWTVERGVTWENAMSASLIFGPAFTDDFKEIIPLVLNAYEGSTVNFLTHVHLVAGGYAAQAAELALENLRSVGFRYNMISDDYYLTIIRELGLVSSQNNKLNKVLKGLSFNSDPNVFAAEALIRLESKYIIQDFRRMVTKEGGYVYCPASTVMRNVALLTVYNMYLYKKDKSIIKLSKNLLVEKDILVLKDLFLSSIT